MFDASVKSPVGMDYGNEYQFGNFDQCLESREQHGKEIQPKYCLLKVNLVNSRTIHWGICLPDSCSNEEFTAFLKNYTGSQEVIATSKLCQSHITKEYNSLDIIVG